VYNEFESLMKDVDKEAVAYVHSLQYSKLHRRLLTEFLSNILSFYVQTSPFWCSVIVVVPVGRCKYVVVTLYDS